MVFGGCRINPQLYNINMPPPQKVKAMKVTQEKNVSDYTLMTAGCLQEQHIFKKKSMESEVISVKCII